MKIQTTVYRDANCLIASEIIDPILEIMKSMTPEISKNSVSQVRDALLSGIMTEGWSRNAGLSHKSKITISGYKNGIGLCIQTGNVSRIYADLLKLQTLWVSSKITAGLIIVPIKSNAIVLGSNLASYERLNTELDIFKHVITMPLIVVGFDGLGGTQNA